MPISAMQQSHDHYNISRFILDESLFGSLLSDYSGIKIEKDGPVLSFGRVNFFRFSGTSIKVIESYLRNHYEQAFSNDIYRLDVAVLGETEPHTKDYKGIYERNHQWYNSKALHPLPQSLLPEIKFAKAQIVLSDQLCFLKFFEFSFITTFVCNFVFYSSKKCIFDNKNPNLIIEKFCIKQQLLLRSYG